MNTPIPAAARPSDTPRLPVSMLLKDIAVFAKVVPNVRGVLRDTGFDPVTASPTDLIGVAAYLKVTERLLQEPGTDGMGLEVGVTTGSPREQGILGYTMLSCSTLQQALQLWQRYNALWPLWQWPFDGRFSHHGEQVTIELIEPEHRVTSDRLRIYGIEVWMGNWVATFDDLFGQAVHFTEIELSSPDPGYAARYSGALRCPVRFGRPVSLIRFSASLLKRPVHEGNETVRAFCEQECAKMLAEMDPQGGIIDRIRHMLLRNAGQFPSMETVADRLHMSERSLRRKLDALDSSFKDILDEVRMHLAARYLKDSHMKTQQISELLAYSEVAAFNRAFKRWYGVPPTTYRGQPEPDEAEQ